MMETRRKLYRSTCSRRARRAYMPAWDVCCTEQSEYVAQWSADRPHAAQRCTCWHCPGAPADHVIVTSSLTLANKILTSNIGGASRGLVVGITTPTDQIKGPQNDFKFHVTPGVTSMRLDTKRCCHLANYLINFIGNKQTNRQTERRHQCAKPPH